MVFAAIDWAEESHLVIVLNEEGEILERTRIQHEAWDLAHLESLLTLRHPGPEVHVAIELHDGLLLDRLLRLGVRVYGLNPKSAQRVRERYTPSGLKDDDRDAWSMAEFIRTSYRCLRPVRPDSPATLALREWVALRENLVQERTTHLQRLRSHLVCWHPHVLRVASDLMYQWVLDLLEAFPTADSFAELGYNQAYAWSKGRRLREITRDRLGVAATAPSPTREAARNAAHAAEVRYRVRAIQAIRPELEKVETEMEKILAEHPDAFIFQSLPSARTCTVAAMLAGFGDDRDRWRGYEEVAARWGMAPITVQSGKYRSVRRRKACNTTLHQAWLWFAFHTVQKAGSWAREDYQAKRRGGAKHYTALRGIGDRWVKIAYRCWMNRTPYDEHLHQKHRAQRMAPRGKNDTPAIP